MTPTNLPDLYSRVVARRPELAVKELARDLNVHNDYLLEPDGPIADSILAKWVKALPEHVALERVNDTWWVYHIARERGRRVGPTPLEAIAAFWLEYNP